MPWTRYILAFVVLLACFAVVATLARPKIARAELGISARDSAQCESPGLPVYPRPGYNKRLAAHDYMPYAVAALNVYTGRLNGKARGFALKQHSPEWVKVQTIDPRGGLAIDVYHRSEPGKLTVMSAFRGTQKLDRADWIANLSWLVSWLTIETQYDQALRIYREAIREPAYALAAGRKVSFIAVGHSLGGGLAQHIAFAYPCVGAVVFNSSFVTNRYRLAMPYNRSQIIHIFEDQDRLTRLRRLLFVDRETKYYKHYKQNAIRDDSGRYEYQHSMTGLAVGMARQVLRCQVKRPKCKVPKGDMRTRNLLCRSGYGKNRKTGKARPICRRAAAS